MTSLEIKLRPLQTALVGVLGDKAYHYWRPKMDPPYCVWQEDAEESSLTSSNHKQAQVIAGSVDYFTKTEYDSNIDSIQSAMTAVENISWNLDMVVYEEDANLIHYHWNFRAM